MIDSIIPLGLILLYLLIIFLVNYYKNISPKKRKNHQINLDDINPAISFYCYYSGNTSKLFWLTLLDLINRGYYKLYSKEDISYIKWNKNDILKIDELSLKEFEKILVTYINTTMYKNDAKETISLDLLEKKVSSDWSYQSVLNNFITELKKEVSKTCGNIDKISILEIPLILTFLYSVQVLYFFDMNFSVSQILLLSIPLTFITLLITDALKHIIVKYTLKKHIIAVIISIIMAVISFNIWKDLNDVDYIIFHVLMGVFAFMYPLLIITNLYYIKTTPHYFNKLQKDIINQLDELKIDILDEKIKKIDYVYTYGLKVKNTSKNKEYNDFVDIFKM